jgi:hypothetical protein
MCSNAAAAMEQLGSDQFSWESRMTHDQIQMNAYDEARRHFIRLVLSGRRLDSACEERERIFESSRRSRCTFCLVEKHVSEFYDRGCGPQAWCIECMKANIKARSCTDSAKWKAIRSTELELA